MVREPVIDWRAPPAVLALPMWQDEERATETLARVLLASVTR